MKITLTSECEKLVVSQLTSGRFQDAESVVEAALNSFSANVDLNSPVDPPGSLSHLYTAKANEVEAKTGDGNSLEVEAW